MNNKIKSIRQWMWMCIGLLLTFQGLLCTTSAQNDPNTRTIVFHANSGTFATGKTPGAYSDNNNVFTITNVGIGEDALIKTYAPGFAKKPKKLKYWYDNADGTKGTVFSDATTLAAGTDVFNLYAIWTDISKEDFSVTLPKDLTYKESEKKVAEVKSLISGLGTITVLYKPLFGDNQASVADAPVNPGHYQLYMNVAASDNNSAIENMEVGMMTIGKATQTPPANIVGVNTTGANDGKITGVSSDMEYRSINSSDYTAITGTEVTTLAPGIYYVRQKSNEFYHPSADVTVTIAKGSTPLFTVTYLIKEGNIYLEQFIYSGSLTTRPAINPVKEDATFEEWVTTADSNTPFNFDNKITANTTIYAKWQANPKYSIKGTVTDESGLAIKDATVVIHPFGTSVTTKEDGTFELSGIPAGSYNLIVTDLNGYSVTQLVEIKDTDIEISEKIKINGKANSKLIVETGAPSIVVDGLDKLAASEQAGTDNILIKLVASPRTEDTADGAAEIKELMKGDKMELTSILDLTLFKTVNDGTPEKLTELNSQLIEVIIPIPESLRGNKNFALYRYHGTSVDKITTTLNADGEQLVIAGNYVAATLKKFSSYALGTARTFTVNYMLNELTIFTNQSVAEGALTTAPSPAPSKSGYTFGGWYKEVACTNAWKFDTDVVNANLSLYPKWNAATPPPTPTYYYDIEGKITNEGNTPLAGAKVQLLDKWNNVQEEKVTDKNGNYTFFSLYEGTYSLLISLEQYQSARVQDFYLDRDMTHNVVLKAIATGLDTAEGDNTHVYGAKASLIIETGTGKSYRIINISGAPVTVGTTTGNRITIPVTAGIYLVILDKNQYKVIVR